MLQKQNLPSDKIYTRSANYLEQRDKKLISREVMLWNKHYCALKRQEKSGWVEEDYVGEASHLQRCVPVLQKLPKFDSMFSPSHDVVTPADVATSAKKKNINNNNLPQGSKIDHQIGSQKAKVMKLLEDLNLIFQQLHLKMIILILIM
jgi:hypothetical protein